MPEQTNEIRKKGSASAQKLFCAGALLVVLGTAFHRKLQCRKRRMTDINHKENDFLYAFHIFAKKNKYLY